MAIRAKLIMYLCALLGGLCALAGTPNVANAHPGHDHAPPTARAPAQAPQAVAPAAAVDKPANQRPAVLKKMARNGVSAQAVTDRPRAPQPFQQSNCCCGSIACHAGVEARAAQLWPDKSRLKFGLPPVLAIPDNEWGGIERPPRGPAAL